jgi:20S proteasome alpha/beta subunit
MKILNIITRHCSPVKISQEEAEHAAIQVISKAQQVDKHELEDFAGEIAIIMAKVSNREYRNFEQIERDYGMLYARTFISREGAYIPTPDQPVFFA